MENSVSIEAVTHFRIAAKKRMDRAWAEASYKNKKLSPMKKVRLKVLGSKQSKLSKTLSEVFDSVKDIPCATCDRCCTKAGMDSGFFTHDERGRILEQGVDITKFVVKKWDNKKSDPPWRCLFLSPTGCNIPAEHRSANCLSYVCRDLLGPAINKQGLEFRYRSARSKLQISNLKTKSLSYLSYETNEQLNFGQG